MACGHTCSACTATHASSKLLNSAPAGVNGLSASASFRKRNVATEAPALADDSTADGAADAADAEASSSAAAAGNAGNPAAATVHDDAADDDELLLLLMLC